MSDTLYGKKPAVDTEEEDLAKEIAELDLCIAREEQFSKEYFLKCASDIKKWDRKELANLSAYSVPHKIPFKVRWRNFWNKQLNTFGNGRTKRLV